MILLMKSISYGDELREEGLVLKPREIIIEARDIVNEVPSKIFERVLKQSVDLKPEYISLISKTRDIYASISSLLNRLSSVIKENTGTNTVINIGKNMYVAFHTSGFYIIRSKPFHIILSYSRDTGEYSIKTKKMNIVLTPSYINASVLSVKTSIEINKVDSYMNKYREFKYIINYLSRIIEKYLLPVVEARVRETR